MFINKMPDTPEVINCPKHGSFEAKYMRLPMSHKIMESRECSKCIIERDDRKSVEEKQKVIDESQRLATQRRVKAGISKRNINKTFDDYICNTQAQQHAKTIAENFVKNFPGDQNILMLGSVGTGKTLLASVIIEALLPDYRCLLVKVMDIVRAIKGTWRRDSEQSESDLIDILINKDLLVIDEVGTQFGSDTEKLFIFDIIDGRYQAMKPTILISNLDIDGVKNVIGDRCVDRLREGGGKMIAFDWDSQRK
jgi:DNA replication protein DnaC